MPNDQSNDEFINERELCALNLFFGINIVVLSIFVMILFIVANINTQIIIISISLLMIGVTFTGIGIPDKHQTVAAATIEIILGSIVTGGGIICVFISLINSNLIIPMFIIINLFLAFAGFAGTFAPLSEDRSKIRSRWIIAGLGGIIMLFCSVINIIFLIFEIFDLIVIKILMFGARLFHGLARIILYQIGIFKKEYLM